MRSTLKEISSSWTTLSALDVHVGKEVFSELIRKHLKKKTVVLVTHDWGLLPSADRIVYLDDGRVLTSDSVEAMASTSETFRALMKQHEKDVSGGGDERETETASPIPEASTGLVEVEVRAENIVDDAAGKTASASAEVVAATAEEDNGESIAGSRSNRGKLTGKEVRQRGSLSCLTVFAISSLFPACRPV